MGYKTGGLENNRYIVKRSNKSEREEGDIPDYFILRIDKDPHALVALEAYANSVKIDNEELYNDLINKIKGENR